MRVIDIKESGYTAMPSVYIELLKQRLNEIEDPCIVTDGSSIYYAAHSGNHFGVVEDGTKVLNCQSIYLGENISLGDQELDVDRMYDDGEFCYRLPEGIVDKVTRCDKGTNNLFSLYKEETELGQRIMVFKQHVKGNDVELRYDVTNLDSIESMIEHCLTYTPKEINLSKYKDMLLYFGRELNLHYKFDAYKYEYYRYLINLGNMHFCKSPKRYAPRDLLSSIESEGYYVNIPDDIINIITGKHKIYNKIKMVTNSYRQHIGL